MPNGEANTMKLRLCRFLGHDWTINDYTESIKGNGQPYAFKKRRECLRCSKVEYLFDHWIDDKDVDDSLKDHVLTHGK